MSRVRVTRDVFEVHGDYGHGFEMVTAADTYAAARQHCREYRENEPGIPFCVLKKRERLEPQPAPRPPVEILADALRGLLDAMEPPRSAKASAAWDAAREALRAAGVQP